MTAEDLLFDIGALVVAYVGILIGTVAMPFSASFMLDGIVELLRGKSPKLFVLALAFTAVLAGGGYFLWKFGCGNPTGTLAALASMAVVTQFLLTFSTVLALVGFGARTAKLLSRSR